MSGAVAAVVAVQHSTRAARQGPCSTGDAKKGTLEIDSFVEWLHYSDRIIVVRSADANKARDIPFAGSFAAGCYAAILLPLVSKLCVCQGVRMRHPLF